MPTFQYPNATSPQSLLDYNNSITGGFFGSSIIIMVFIMSFMMLMGIGGPKKAFVVSSWLSFMVSLPLAAMGTINSSYPIVLIAVGCVSLIPIFLSEK